MFRWPPAITLENPPQQARGLRSAIRLAAPPSRTITNSALQIAFHLVLNPKAAALCVSLVLSALLTAAALRVPNLHWLAWISFVPLFVVVRSLSPSPAATAGGFWGGCLYLFCATGSAPAIGASPSLLALLIVIPAVYLGLAARPARAIGFKLLILALGWTLVEVVLRLHNPSGAGEGLLAGPVGGASDLHWFARLLGYVCTAFLVASANASLIVILSRAHLCFPALWSLEESPNPGTHPPSQVFLPNMPWTLRQARPRAPPIPAVTVS